MSKKRIIKISSVIVAVIIMLVYIFYSISHEISEFGKDVPFIIGMLLAVVFWTQKGTKTDDSSLS